MLDGDERLDGPAAGGDPPVFRGQVGVVSAGGGHGGDAQGAFEIGVAGSGLGGLDPAGGLVAAGAGPGPGREVAGGGEAGHVGAGLGDGDVGDSGADPGQGGDQVPDYTKGFDHHLDPGGEVVDGAGVLVDQVQVQPGQEGVVLTEPSGQRLGQFGDLAAQPPLGQLRQRGRVALPGDQRLEHGPAGDAADVGGHRRQLDPRVLQQLLQPLDLTGAFPRDGGPGPGQVPELTDRLGWHKRATASPCAPSCASHAASETSVLRPGRFLTCRALTSSTSNGPSSSR